MTQQINEQRSTTKPMTMKYMSFKQFINENDEKDKSTIVVQQLKESK